MKQSTAKTVTRAFLLGAIGMSFGIGLATVMEVEVAPPIQALPITVVNLSWALVAFYLISFDIRFGYVLSLFVGIAVIALPILVFTNSLGPAPQTVPTHFYGVTTDFIIGIVLIVASVRGLQDRQ